jgi:hypothetical protein
VSRMLVADDGTLALRRSSTILAYPVSVRAVSRSDSGRFGAGLRSEEPDFDVGVYSPYRPPHIRGATLE